MEKSWTSQTLHQDTFGLKEGIKLKNFLLYFLDVECHTTQFLVKASRYHENQPRPGALRRWVLRDAPAPR